MGVLIRGMEMPKNCNTCNFHMLRFCCAADKDLAEKDTRPLIERRPDYCPLIPVPPHGDLIDRDALMKGEGRYLISFGKEGIDIAEIENAPTIIPAEEGE